MRWSGIFSEQKKKKRQLTRTASRRLPGSLQETRKHIDKVFSQVINTHIDKKQKIKIKKRKSQTSQPGFRPRTLVYSPGICNHCTEQPAAIPKESWVMLTLSSLSLTHTHTHTHTHSWCYTATKPKSRARCETNAFSLCIGTVRF